VTLTRGSCATFSIEDLARTCNALSERAGTHPLSTLCAARDFADRVPSGLSTSDALQARSLLCQIFGQAVLGASLHTHAEVARRLALLTVTSVASERWRHHWMLAIDSACTALTCVSNPVRERESAIDQRVTRVLGRVSDRYAESSTTLNGAARDESVSACRLAHLMKQHTGATFQQHLHRRRIAEARRLLETTALSVKEVAARVGYSSTTQLDRRFRTAAGTTPRRYREAMRSAGAIVADETNALTINSR
jgi:AraC-like DNA-binding protein